ncbi:MAG TPA: UDP-N-acetylmuramoyl-tripeptide--D-alanyl-D-alanine ligase [Vicinamibacterales bacterium]|nr:UDP-N-acetylmuramoyl-tripeptide--D-alanyl-D-alanine ligase [Vicinamibacterales bacterium]
MSTAGALVLTAGLVAEVTGGQLVSGSTGEVFSSVSTDSRTLRPGAMFVALEGARDGHVFVGPALSGGATGLLVTRPPERPGGAAVIVVPDTLQALQRLGQDIRRRSGATLVAITGSTGKTTTREIAAHLLAARFAVYRSHGNFNNHIGLPLSLIELVSRPRIAVVELGMNHAGEIRRLVELAEPDVRVWTNVGDAHLEYFGTREAIAAAKAEILEWPTPGMVVVANADDGLVMRHVAQLSGPGRVVTFGEAPRATVHIARIDDHGLDGTDARFETPAGPIETTLALPGRVHVFNAAAAVAVALHFDVPAAELVSRLAGVRPVARRGASTSLASGVRLVDDSYNASPDAMVAMIEALARTAARRRVAVLGEMLELGPAAREKHAACGRAAARAGVDVLVAIGGTVVDALVDGAVSAGLAADRIHRFASAVSAADTVASLVRPGDVVLVKGSRGTATDVVADRLTEAA